MESMSQEIWKAIKGYEGQYEVSDRGNVKSLERRVKNGLFGYRIVSEKILAPRPKNNEYYQVNLCSSSRCKNYHIHSLVAIAFLEHDPKSLLVVNHKDFNRQNNNLNNLEITTYRDNTNQKHLPSTSRFTGVIPIKNKFRAYIKIGGKTKHLGLFDIEEEASKAYENAKNKLTKI